MSKEYIIQLRDNSKAVINAKIINCMIAEDHISQENLLKYGHAKIELFLADVPKTFFYDLESELDYKYYYEDAKRIRFALNKIGGNL